MSQAIGYTSLEGRPTKPFGTPKTGVAEALATREEINHITVSSGKAQGQTS